MWPPVDGLRDVPTWTSDEALSASDRAARLAVLGAGPIGCELAQLFATFPSQVTAIAAAEHPASRVDPALGNAVANLLKAGGVRLRLPP